MKWLIMQNNCKEGYHIELPEHIADKKPFEVVVKGETFNASWDRGQEVLYLKKGTEKLEYVLSLRSATIVKNSDEPQIDLNLEYRTTKGQVRGMRAAFEIYVPGPQHKTLHSENLGTVIKAAMTGKVLTVDIEEGAQVEKGAAICVVEAMKMENQITAPASGTISDLKIKAGDQITAGSKILIIKNV